VEDTTGFLKAVRTQALLREAASAVSDVVAGRINDATAYMRSMLGRTINGDTVHG